MGVDAGVRRIHERQGREPFERLLRLDRAAPDLLEQCAQAFAIHGLASYQNGAVAAPSETSPGIHTSSTAGRPASSTRWVSMQTRPAARERHAAIAGPLASNTRLGSEGSTRVPTRSATADSACEARMFPTSRDR